MGPDCYYLYAEQYNHKIPHWYDVPSLRQAPQNILITIYITLQPGNIIHIRLTSSPKSSVHISSV